MKLDKLNQPIKKKVPKLTPDEIPQSEIDSISEGSTATNAAIETLNNRQAAPNSALSAAPDLLPQMSVTPPVNPQAPTLTPGAIQPVASVPSVGGIKAGQALDRRPISDINQPPSSEKDNYSELSQYYAQQTDADNYLKSQMSRPSGTSQLSTAPTIDFQGDVISNQARSPMPNDATTPPPLTGYARAQQEYNTAIASRPQKQGKGAQALWWALQGIQKFANPKDTTPVQWLGEAKRNYNINQAAQNLAPFQQQEQRNLGIRKEVASLNDTEAVTRSRNINAALASNPWIASEMEQNIIDPNMAAKISAATNGLIKIPPGDYRGKKFGELNGQVGFFDARGKFTPSGDIELAKTPVKVGNAFTTNENAVQLAAANDRQIATQNFTIYRDKLKAKMDKLRSDSVQSSINYRAELNANKSSDKDNVKLTEYTDKQVLLFNRAQSKFNKAQQIAQSWGNDLSDYEIQAKPDYKLYESLMKDAQADVEKAEELGPQIKALQTRK